MNNIWKYSLVLAFSIIIDQLIKGTAQSLVPSEGGTSAIFEFLYFCRIRNSELVFGINIPLISSIQNTLAILFDFVISGLCLWYTVKFRNKFPIMGWGLSILLAGTFTSLMDRWTQGFTLDYFLIKLGEINFSLSLGDIQVAIGLMIIFFCLPKLKSL